MPMALILTLILFIASVCQAQIEPIALSATLRIPEGVNLKESFSFRMCVRLDGAPSDLPMLASNKHWESGKVRSYTTNNRYGMGRESGVLSGFALSVLPDGAWTWNVGDGNARLDHRPEAADQGIADGKWHELGFAVDRDRGVVHLYHDGRRVALHDLQGVGSLQSDTAQVRFGDVEGLEIANVRLRAGVPPSRVVAAEFTARFGEDRRPDAHPVWDGGPLKVLAWNIWHGGRRKGVDVGVSRVVDVIKSSGADIVLMQETYGSGPRISGRLGFDYFLRSSNLSIMSRYPIRDVHRLYSGFRFGGATIELRPGVLVQAYSLWINYLPDVGKALKDGATAKQLAAADAKTRGREVDAILAELLPHLTSAAAVPVIIGGDFNSGSHLDWTESAADTGSHQGRVVAWPVSLSMKRAGFEDSFRSVHSDPVETPGLTWSPEFTEDHQDRIDYIYVQADDWRTIDSRVIAIHPDGWPSDHAAVLSTLERKKPLSYLRVRSYKLRDLDRKHLPGQQSIGKRIGPETSAR